VDSLFLYRKYFVTFKFLPVRGMLIPVADAEICERPCIGFIHRLDMFDNGKIGTDTAPVQHVIHAFGLALEDGLDAAVGKVSHPAHHVIPYGLVAGLCPKEYALDHAGYVYVNSYHKYRLQASGDRQQVKRKRLKALGHLTLLALPG
jgi:hypothetical protein